MTARDGRRERTLRRVRHVRLRLGEELRSARLGAGLSLAAVGADVGMSASKVGRIERGRAPSMALVDVTLIASTLGLDLSVRLYPGATGLRDIGQVRRLERLRARLHPELGWGTEIPVGPPGDQRAWDAVIRGPDWRIGVDCETRLLDFQSVDRRVALKARDSGVDRVVLLLADTRHNHDALGALASTVLASYPATSRSVLRALGEGSCPAGNAIVLV
jgi:transcriptional regulator with XRE-family HTH domain